MKEAFKDCMRHLYPGPSGVTRSQMKDLVRTFSMGWVEGLKNVHNIEAVREWAEGLGKEISEEGWEPDESWIWWTNVDPSIN